MEAWEQTLMRRLAKWLKQQWYSFWHAWRGCPFPLREIDDYHKTCDLCGHIATHSGDWGI